MIRIRGGMLLIALCMIFPVLLSANTHANVVMPEHPAGTERGRINPENIEILQGDIPVEDLSGAETEESENMDNDRWILKMPAISYDAIIRYSDYDSVQNLYQAQIIGETGTESRIIPDSDEGFGNNIICIYDEGQIIPAILESVENGLFGERELIFGLEGFTGFYAVSSVLTFRPSDETEAIRRLTDLSDEGKFEAYKEFLIEHAVNNYDEVLMYGDQIVTIIVWNENLNADWLMVVAKEEAWLLE